MGKRIRLYPAALAWIALVLGLHNAARAAPGAIIVVGNGGEHDRMIVSKALERGVSDAKWTLVEPPFSREETATIVRCLHADRPWPCVGPVAKSRAVDQIIVTQVDSAKTDAGSEFVLVAQLVVAGDGVPASVERHCGPCSDAELTQATTVLLDKLFKEASSRTGRTQFDVRTVPAGVTVTIDTHMMGASPGVFATTPGMHTIWLQHTGYRNEARDVKAVEGETVPVSVEMTPDDGRPVTDHRSYLLPKVLVGAGAATLAAGVALYLLDPDPDPSQGRRIRDTKPAGYVLGGVGVATAAVGGVLWYRRFKAHSAPVVALDGHGATLGWAGGF